MDAEEKAFIPERIRAELVKLNVIDPPAPNTIAKYLPETRKPTTEKQLQAWLTVNS